MLGFLAIAQEALAKIRDRIFSASGATSVLLSAGTARASLAAGQVASCEVAAPGLEETVATGSITVGTT